MPLPSPGLLEGGSLRAREVGVAESASFSHRVAQSIDDEVGVGGDAKARMMVKTAPTAPLVVIDSALHVSPG